MTSFGIDFSNRAKLEGSVSDNGVIALKWNVKAGQVVEVEQAGEAPDVSAVVIYSGTDAATLVTGLREGTFSFRIRDVNAPGWSEPVEVEVRYVSRGKLFSLMILGGIVVAATIFAIVSGAFRSAGKEGAA